MERYFFLVCIKSLNSKIANLLVETFLPFISVNIFVFCPEMFSFQDAAVEVSPPLIFHSLSAAYIFLSLT